MKALCRTALWVTAALAMTSASWAKTQIALNLQPEVASGPVTLGDVARITSGEAGMVERLSAVRIGTAPLPGASRVVSLNSILLALPQHGLNPDLMEITPRGDITLTTHCNRILGAELLEKARELVLAALPYSPDAVQILAKNLPEEIVVDPGDVAVSVVVQPNEDFIGYTFLTFDITVNGQLKRRVSLHLQVSVTAEVAVAAGNIQRGQVLSAADVVFEPRDLATTGGPCVTSLDEIVGMRARVGFRQGQLLVARMLEAPPAVQRGDAVVLQAVAGCVLISAPAVAKQDGRVGDRILVRNQATGKELTARIIDKSTVRVDVRATPARLEGDAS